MDILSAPNLFFAKPFLCPLHDNCTLHTFLASHFCFLFCLLHIMGSIQPPDHGRRLFPVVIDDYARTEPRKAWASIAKSTNLADGYRDIDYGTLANAINRCAWWIVERLGKGSDFQTIAYIGAADPRYFILLYGAIKAGYKVRTPSMFESRFKLC